MTRKLRITITTCSIGFAVALVATLRLAAAHTVAGVCASSAENCEKWSVTVQGPSPSPGHRPDEFPSAIATSGTTVFVGVKAVAFDVNDPYASTASWTVGAY